jgi:hypothetical protein
MTKYTTTHRTHALLQNVAAISAEFHTNSLYGCFYDAFADNIDGAIGCYRLCVEMARALTDWEIQNGGASSAYDNAPLTWMEVTERFVEKMLYISVKTLEIPNGRYILRQVLEDGGAA